MEMQGQQGCRASEETDTRPWPAASAEHRHRPPHPDCHHRFEDQFSRTQAEQTLNEFFNLPKP